MRWQHLLDRCHVNIENHFEKKTYGCNCSSHEICYHPKVALCRNSRSFISNESLRCLMSWALFSYEKLSRCDLFACAVGNFIFLFSPLMPHQRMHSIGTSVSRWIWFFSLLIYHFFKWCKRHRRIASHSISLSLMQYCWHTNGTKVSSFSWILHNSLEALAAHNCPVFFSFENDENRTSERKTLF